MGLHFTLHCKPKYTVDIILVTHYTGEDTITSLTDNQPPCYLPKFTEWNHHQPRLSQVPAKIDTATVQGTKYCKRYQALYKQPGTVQDIRHCTRYQALYNISDNQQGTRNCTIYQKLYKTECTELARAKKI